MIESSENIKGIRKEPVNVPEKKANENVLARDVECLYCHEVFNTEDVLFRADDPYSEEDISKLESEVSELETSVLHGFATEKEKEEFDSHKAELKSKRPFVEKDDKAVRDFWRSKGWPETDCRLREFEWGYSEILNKNNSEGTDINKIKSCILESENIKKVVRDDQGFLTGVVDKRGKKTEKRLCPHCKCLLPKSYGRHDVHFIACIGARGSGKTVFISEFFKSLQEGTLVRKIGTHAFISDNADRFIEDKKICTGEQLPNSTDRVTVKPPIDFCVRENNNQWHTFVFYDIAGENCKNATVMEEKGSFIESAEGIIMLIAPGQIEEIKLADNDHHETGRDEDILEVFRAIANAYGIDENIQNGEKCATKMAVVLSKCDMYDGATKDGKSVVTSNMKNNIDYKRNVEAQREDLRGDINNLLSSTALMENVEGLYENVEYFAVSALGGRAIKKEIDGKEVDFPPEEINPVNIQEPFVWILKELGISHEKNSFSETMKNIFSNRFSGIVRLVKGLIGWLLNN